MLAFGLGAGSVLIGLAYGTRELIFRRRTALSEIGHWAKPALGLVGVLGLTGIDRRIEAVLVSIMPEWLLMLTTSI